MRAPRADRGGTEPGRRRGVGFRTDRLPVRVAALFASIAIAVSIASPALLAQGVDAGKATAEREALKKRIDSLRKDLARTEESRADLADQLRDTDQAVSTAGRLLRELTGDRKRVEAQLREFSSQSAELESRVSGEQTQLARLLVSHHRAGQSDPLRLILGGADPNQVARDYYYLRLLSRAQAVLIDRLRQSLARKRELAERAGKTREELAGIEARQLSEHRQLIAAKAEQARVLARVSDRLRAQQREITTLQRNEKRLARLIEGLGRIIARPSRQDPARGSAPEGGRSAAPRVRGIEVPDPSAGGTPFAELRGRLRAPVSGELLTRFGAPMREGGGSSKGLFIRAENGDEVRVIAGGTVVFAEWLRGFGNLVIVDHGDDFLSVYANNETLLKSVGQEVGAGEPIAAVGASGGNPESGLYFELRHRGRPIDPLKWVNIK